MTAALNLEAPLARRHVAADTPEDTTEVAVGRGQLNGRDWAYIGTLMGAGVSVAANIGETFVAPKGAPADWHPNVVAVLMAPFWPIALFVAVEILTKVEWPKGALSALARWFGVGSVGLIAAVISYQHLSKLIAYAERDLQSGGAHGRWEWFWVSFPSMVGPLGIDGLMTLSATALLLESKRRRDTAGEGPAPAVDTTPLVPEGPTYNSEPRNLEVVRPAVPARQSRKVTQGRRAALTDAELVAFVQAPERAGWGVERLAEAVRGTGRSVSEARIRKVRQP